MGEVAGRLEVSVPRPGPGEVGLGKAPWVWARCQVEDDEVVVRLGGWRRVLATRATLRLPLASIVRVAHDPLARAHVRSGLRNWKRHGQGMWRLGIYHGIDGWSFWSIGVGRNAVLMECSGERFRYVVVEVADPARTVEEIRTAVTRVTSRVPGSRVDSPPSARRLPRTRGHREPGDAAGGEE